MQLALQRSGSESELTCDTFERGIATTKFTRNEASYLIDDRRERLRS